MPLTNEHVDKCIECGFCEVNCLTAGFTLSSRQRIVAQREITRIKDIPEQQERLKRLKKQYAYAGNDTCAGDGLCATSCPMNINTGHLTHDLRAELLPQDSIGYQLGMWTANHFAGVKAMLRPVLTLADTAHSIIGTRNMTALAKGLRSVSGNSIPLWTSAMPKAYTPKATGSLKSELKVVYFPSCLNQTMGTAHSSPDHTPLVDKTVALLEKAGYEVIFPSNMNKLCCGTIWESKGMPEIADRKAAELEEALYIATENGRYPVLCDQSPCLYRMRNTMKSVKLYEPAEFILTFLCDKLEFTPIKQPVAIHITCSMKKMKLEKQLIALAGLCSEKVLVPEEVGCCGFAGDKGFTHPEVNAYALRKLRPQLEKAGIEVGYSNSRTCEIGLTTNSDIPYLSIVYLVDQCTKQKGGNS
ncbi:MAG: (Fe-S)-binding protein, partial [Parabacteroides sp.]|nr:(Fe-S)-binding protein [Parabacteroides sp.]